MLVEHGIKADIEWGERSIGREYVASICAVCPRRSMAAGLSVLSCRVGGMGVARFELIVQGQSGEISLDAFSGVLKHANDVLRSVAKSVSGSKKRVVRGYVTDLKLGSLAATLEVRPEPAAVGADPERSVLQLIRGLEMVEARDELPPDFDERALRSSKKMAGEIAGGAEGLTLRLLNGGEDATTEVSRRLIDNVDRALKPASTAIGGIYGTVDVLNARSKKPWFGIRDELSRRPVRCDQPEVDVDRIKSLFGRRVYAHGQLTLNARGQTTQIGVHDLSELPSLNNSIDIERLLGAFPGRTGDKTPEEFVRELRDDDRESHGN